MYNRLFFSLGMCVLSVGFAQAQPTPGSSAPPYSPPGEWRVTPRTLTTPASARDLAQYRAEPGDKVNKIPEATSNRLFTSPDSGRSAVPPLPEVPIRKVSGKQ